MQNHRFLYLIIFCLLAVNRPLNANTVKSLDISSFEKSFLISGQFFTPLFTEVGKSEKDEALLTNVTTVEANIFLTRHHSINVSSSFQKDLSSLQGDLLLQDSQIQWNYKINNNKYKITFTSTTGIIIPISKYSQEITSLYLGIGQGFQANKFFFKDFEISYNFSYLKNIHKYDSSTNGLSNTNHEIINSFNFSYRLLNFLYLKSKNSYIINYNYNKVRDDYYNLSQSLLINFDRNTSLEFGHMVGTTILTKNKQKLNIHIYDELESTLFLTLNHNF